MSATLWTMEIGSSDGFLPDTPINLLSRMKKLPEVILGATLDESLLESKAFWISISTCRSNLESLFNLFFSRRRLYFQRVRIGKIYERKFERSRKSGDEIVQKWRQTFTYYASDFKFLLWWRQGADHAWWSLFLVNWEYSSNSLIKN